MNLEQAVTTLKDIYGDSAWIDAMAAMGPSQASGLGKLASAILDEGPLPRKIKHYMLFIIHLANCNEPMAKLHADHANHLGATALEWHEVLAVFAPSRGETMYASGARVLGLKASKEDTMQEEAEQAFDRDGLLSYFRGAMGTVPAFVQTLADKRPAVFEGYFRLRSANLRNGELPQKYKELMLVALNTAERYETGVDIHAKAALGCGASTDELLDGMVTAILAGGIPGWIEASKVYGRLAGKSA